MTSFPRLTEFLLHQAVVAISESGFPFLFQEVDEKEEES